MGKLLLLKWPNNHVNTEGYSKCLTVLHMKTFSGREKALVEKTQLASCNIKNLLMSTFTMILSSITNQFSEPVGSSHSLGYLTESGKGVGRCS